LLGDLSADPAWHRGQREQAEHWDQRQAREQGLPHAPPGQRGRRAPIGGEADRQAGAEQAQKDQRQQKPELLPGIGAHAQDDPLLGQGLLREGPAHHGGGAEDRSADRHGPAQPDRSDDEPECCPDQDDEHSSTRVGEHQRHQQYGHAGPGEGVDGGVTAAPGG
jgi:hypothetical protein